MAITKSPYLCNPSIMAHPDYKVLDVRMDLTGVDCILAGSPINAAGQVANDDTCIGILLHDCHACLGAKRTGQVVIAGLIDQETALQHSGIQISDAAKSALVNVSFTGDGSRMGGGSGGGGISEERVVELINEQLGVIENGTY